MKPAELPAKQAAMKPELAAETPLDSRFAPAPAARACAHAGAGEVPAHVSDITTAMSLPTLTPSPSLPLSLSLRTARALRRSRNARRSTLGASSSLRMDAAAPSLRHAPDSPWQRFVFWLLAPAPSDAAPPLNRLPGVRDDFIAAVADLAGEEADSLRYRVVHARSLRELWHLRAEVFRLVGLTLDQGEAERRLLQLNRHFPMRASRSQFGAL